MIKVEGGYRMYYHGLGPQRPNAASKGYILSAFSSDTELWEKEPGVRMDAGGEGAADYIWRPDVIPLTDGRYRMYYEGKTDQAGEGESGARLSAPCQRTVSFGKRNWAFDWALRTLHTAPPGASI